MKDVGASTSHFPMGLSRDSFTFLLMVLGSYLEPEFAYIAGAVSLSLQAYAELVP
jgi:hypothetical protein